MIQANSINEIRFYRCYCTTVLFNGIIQRDYSTGLFSGFTQRCSERPGRLVEQAVFLCRGTRSLEPAQS